MYLAYEVSYIYSFFFLFPTQPSRFPTIKSLLSQRKRERNKEKKTHVGPVGRKCADYNCVNVACYIVGIFSSSSCLI